MASFVFVYFAKNPIEAGFNGTKKKKNGKNNPFFEG